MPPMCISTTSLGPLKLNRSPGFFLGRLRYRSDLKKLYHVKETKQEITLSKSVLHWEKCSWCLLNSTAPIPLTRTITTFCMLLTLMISHQSGTTASSGVNANKISSGMLEIFTGERA